ncbi:hypothetical protein KVR01_000353 [Diaporthe batatas]|uniref:uncharacterized protein n=1 Tax=Diaporthe batatas TaxID=748121 RepID=UPI001D039CAA|nr:uncharacterized protein KVR01_000353 [Diaporthe batatas]KAG8169608.1 hypothetical protein KVR01_000353 [Diaporthe batatas]
MVQCAHITSCTFHVHSLESQSPLPSRTSDQRADDYQLNMYKPLGQRQRTIRLLTLLPGSGEICCRLTVSSLEDARGRYKALSYNWDPPEKAAQQRIYFEKVGAVSVMPNLHAALCRLRDATDVVVLWVDRLCIDQKNTEERTHQVGMMRDIYTNSIEVIVWLGAEGKTGVSRQPITEFWGDERDNQHIASHLGRMYIQNQRASEDSYTGLMTNMYGAFCMISLLAQGLEASKIWYLRRLDYAPAIIQGLKALLGMSWWTRIWVVQETVVASRAIVFCGNISMPWEVFSRAAYQISRHSVELLGLIPARTYGSTLSCFYRQINEIDYTRASWNAVEPSALLPLLRKFRNRDATDPRDKVFALLGLVKYWGGSDPLEPDYNQRLSLVYLETTKHLIRGYKSLAVLSGTKASPQTLFKGFPTWLTDWNYVPPTDEADRLGTQHLYQTLGDAVGGVRLHGTTLLEIRGVRVDRISSTFSSDPPVELGQDGQNINNTNTNKAKTLHNICSEWWERVSRPASALYEYGASEIAATVWDAFWRTLCADLIYLPSAFTEKNKFRRTKPADSISFEKWRTGQDLASDHRRTSIVHGMFIDSVSEEDVEAQHNYETFHRSIECATRGRSFFLTEKGGMGLGPETCQKGDEVHLVLGSRVPMILRASDRTRKCEGKRVERLVLSAEEENVMIAAGRPGAAETLKARDRAKDSRCYEDHAGCFALVGEAYVHGIMDGNLRSEDAPRIFLV